MTEFPAMAALGLVILRLTLATILVAHGAHTLFGLFGGPAMGTGGLTAASASFAAMGLSPGFAFALLTGVVQMVGGALVAIGLLTRSAAVAVMTVAGAQLWKGQWQWGFFLNWVVDPSRGHGIEFSVLLIGALMCLVMTGAGPLSFDGRRASSAASRASARARMRTRG